jgi:hypothetical protein
MTFSHHARDLLKRDAMLHPIINHATATFDPNGISIVAGEGAAAPLAGTKLAPGTDVDKSVFPPRHVHRLVVAKHVRVAVGV